MPKNTCNVNHLLGNFCSISGGLHKAFVEAEYLGVDTFQMCTKNQRQWKPRSFSKNEVEAFQLAKQHSGILRIVSHASYLVNPASPNEDLWHRSVDELVDEVNRCHSLGLEGVVVHPGFHRGTTEADGIQRIRRALRSVIKATAQTQVKVLLENMAGQGSVLGWRFEQLGTIIEGFPCCRVGVCLDLCHAFAAGHDVREAGGLDRMLSKFDSHVGLDRISAIHLSDSKGQLGMRLDRHEHIGQGEIGIKPFRQVLKRFPAVPKLIETPKSREMDIANLSLLREIGPR